MEDTTSVNEMMMAKKKPEEPPPRRRPKKLFIPRRKPSLVIPPKEIVYLTADKTTCKTCVCFPKEDPYRKPKKLNPCQHTPLTLYELTAVIVDQLSYPHAFDWSEDEVASWMEEVVGFPQYRTCILDNHINGRRLLMLEDPSHMPEINIHYFDHIQIITAKIHELFHTEYIRFARSVGLPPRKPPTHCTWFKSRTGPTWGIRQNWTRSDILRWMKILVPAPIYRDHWDLVWYLTPDFPHTLFGPIPKRTTHEHIPHYKRPKHEPCREYEAPRKFILQKDIPKDQQKIWMEHRPGSPIEKELTEKQRKKQEAEEKKTKPFKPTVPKKSRLDRPRISLTGLSGEKLLLARRLVPRKKFLVFDKNV